MQSSKAVLEGHIKRSLEQTEKIKVEVEVEISTINSMRKS